MLLEGELVSKCVHAPACQTQSIVAAISQRMTSCKNVIVVLDCPRSSCLSVSYENISLPKVALTKRKMQGEIMRTERDEVGRGGCDEV